MTPPRKAKYNSHGSPKASLLLFGTPSWPVSCGRHNQNSIYTSPYHYLLSSTLFRDGTTAASPWHKLHSQRGQYAHNHAYQGSPADFVQAHAVILPFSRRHQPAVARGELADGPDAGDCECQPENNPECEFHLRTEWGGACVLCMGVPSLEPEKLADIFRKARTRQTDLSKALRRSGSHTSTATGFISAISPGSRGRRKPNSTLHTSRASIHAPAGAGLRATTNHQPRPLASFSPRS